MAALTRAEVLQARAQPRPRPFIPERKGHVTAILRTDRRPAVVFPPRKEQAPCCRAIWDREGRPPLGFCSPECLRRPGNWALHLEGRPVPKGGIPPRPTQGDDDHG